MCLLYLEHLVPLPTLDIIHLSNLDYNILSIFHNLGSPLSYRTLIVDLMKNSYIYNACIYIHSILIFTPVFIMTSGNQGQAWQFTGDIQIPDNTDKIEIVSIVGGGYQGDIAIDDLVIKCEQCMTTRYGKGTFQSKYQMT